MRVGRALLLAHPYPGDGLLDKDGASASDAGRHRADLWRHAAARRRPNSRCAAGDRIALVGRNGSGKSTLLKIAAGLIEPQDGKVFRHPSATVRYLPQMPDMEGFATVRAYVEAGLGPADDPHRATYLLDHLGLTGEEKPDELSGGEARRAALARVMAPEPDILLLDEPTNHLDLPGDRMAGRRAQPLVVRPCRHLARPPLPGTG